MQLIHVHVTCMYIILCNVIILHSCKGNTCTPTSTKYNAFSLNTFSLTVSSTELESYRQVNKLHNTHARALMKTVLVLIMLVRIVTIACCYTRPVERANEPSLSYWQSSHSETAEHYQHPEHPGK